MNSQMWVNVNRCRVSCVRCINGIGDVLFLSHGFGVRDCTSLLSRSFEFVRTRGYTRTRHTSSEGKRGKT